MAGQEQRPVRRTVAFGHGVLVGVGLLMCAIAVLASAFLAVVVHLVFLTITVAVSAGLVGIGWWRWRDLRRTDKAMAPIEETVLVNVEAIANSRPPTRRPNVARRLLKAMHRARSRTQEGVS